MRNHLLIPALCLLAGCAMPTSDLLDNQYMARVAEPVPAGTAGEWTGTMGPYLMSLRIEASGAGIVCSSYNTTNTVGNLKYSGGNLYFQDGTRAEIRPAGDTLALTSPYFGKSRSTFYRDPGLAQAAPYCKRNM